MPKLLLPAASTLFMLFIALILVAPQSSLAAPKGDQDIVKTLTKAQGMIRQLSQEKMELEARLAPMQKELDDTKLALDEQSKLAAAKVKELELAQLDLQRKADIIAAHAKNAEVYKKNIEILKQSGEKLKEELQQLNQELAATQQDNTLLVGAVNERTDWIGRCIQKNSDLIKTNKEMLDNFGNQNFWDALKEAEPLTGIGAVAKENKLESYRYNLNSLRVTPWEGDTGAGAPAK